MVSVVGAVDDVEGGIHKERGPRWCPLDLERALLHLVGGERHLVRVGGLRRHL